MGNEMFELTMFLFLKLDNKPFSYSKKESESNDL